jgi:hypothetical protein
VGKAEPRNSKETMCQVLKSIVGSSPPNEDA